uniref:histidine kinase n=1 Tax=Chromera velia CCMP2878 TaxID=1169474 RepID=A0A0G4I5N0_9ALVE|eukprot:Cvel_11225.t1-p1 / transcript=Cvel_11225.t1 / gene=Cvel_11225 / organism=Chromera_velia_CCMP2878 / gene_product=hypothetical protein / transcript_product=hypothetical protein / location=Cvel_scaffold698:54394-56149(-) / protein_length=486 / sequence_SO=supercontig / SO=protein_coding / is_pseudo=false
MGVADFTRLDQVISNFLNNAKKFTQTGSVQLRFEVRRPTEAEEEERRGWEEEETLQGDSALKWDRKRQTVTEEREGEESQSREVKDKERGEKVGGLTWVLLHVRVIDSGAGLSEGDRSKLFQPYAQVRAGELQNGEGTGLGLCICKNFVEAHTGGRVGARSAGRGKGSTLFFQIFVPLLEESPGLSVSPPPQHRESNVPSPPFVDPPESEAAAAADERRASLYSIYSDNSEIQSLVPALFPSDPSPPPPPPPLSQDQKEEMEKESTGAGGKERNGAAEASVSAERSPCKEGGGSRSRELEAEETGANSPACSADVLLVDDDRFCLMGGSAALRRLGYSVLTAEDGEDACKLVISQNSSFRFILMDKNMARMEGPEAIRRMGAHFLQLALSKGKERGGEDKEEKGARAGMPEGEAEGGEKIRKTLSRPFFIGCTGDATQEAINCFMEAGADRVLFVQPSKIREILEDLQPKEILKEQEQGQTLENLE